MIRPTEKNWRRCSMLGAKMVNFSECGVAVENGVGEGRPDRVGVGSIAVATAVAVAARGVRLGVAGGGIVAPDAGVPAAAVAVPSGVAVRAGVSGGVIGVSLDEAVGVMTGVTVDVGSSVSVAEGLPPGVGVRVNPEVRVIRGVSVRVRVGVGVTVGVRVRVGVGVTVGGVV